MAALAVALAATTGAAAGETRCWIDHGALVAPAAFGDIAGDFLIDLAAPHSQLHDTRAGADGLTATHVAASLLLAGEMLGHADLEIRDLDARTRLFDTTINGVIGLDVLGGYVVEIDPSPCRLRLIRRRPPREATTSRLALRVIDGLPLAPATITDGHRLRTGWFAIDTAHWTTAVARARPSRPPPRRLARPIRRRPPVFGQWNWRGGCLNRSLRRSTTAPMTARLA